MSGESSPESTARWLVSAQGRAEVDAEPDPDSLSAAERLRRRLPAERAAAVLNQVALRRRAVGKFGAAAASMFFTPDALEQASRPTVSAWRASRFVAAGATTVVDLGCGIGADAVAMRAAGLAVVAVERDPVTAVFASANLGQDVLVADAETTALPDDAAVFIDPARRTSRGRTWNVADFSPAWDFVVGLLAREAPVNVKLGPGVPYRMLPEGVEATWVSEHGDVVEASLWSGEFAPGVRAALLLPSGFTRRARGGVAAAVRRPQPGDVLLEPDGALIRAGCIDDLAAELGAARVHPDIAYLLSSDAASGQGELVSSGAMAAFEIDEVLAYREKDLRAWVRRCDIGTLEIKKRGVDVDPASLRRRLRPSGTEHATLVLSPTASGAVALACRRL